MEQVQCRDIRHSYDGVRDAVSALSLAVRRGEVLALIGPNGAGKSTTLRVLATLQRPDDGRVLWRHAVKAFRGMNILPPTAVGDEVFTSSYGGGAFLFSIDRDGRNKLSSSCLGERCLAMLPRSGPMALPCLPIRWQLEHLPTLVSKKSRRPSSGSPEIARIDSGWSARC